MLKKKKNDNNCSLSARSPGPYDEVLRLRERRHVTERWPDQAVGRVTQEVSKQAGVGRWGPFRGETHLGRVWDQVVGGVQVEVCDVPEPAWTEGGKMKLGIKDDGLKLGYFRILHLSNLRFKPYVMFSNKQTQNIFLI